MSQFATLVCLLFSTDAGLKASSEIPFEASGKLHLWHRMEFDSLYLKPKYSSLCRQRFDTSATRTDFSKNRPFCLRLAKFKVFGTNPNMFRTWSVKRQPYYQFVSTVSSAHTLLRPALVSRLHAVERRHSPT